MQPAPAKTLDPASYEDLGRATLQIVHDLKNQLNGLKLYATFLRKRLERDDQSTEERETLLKLIAGLDRTAKEMSALVRYGRPIELRLQANADLTAIVANVANDAATRETGGLARAQIITTVTRERLRGEFDPAALTEALKSVTDDVRANAAVKGTLSLEVRREANGQLSEALVEWRGARISTRNLPFHSDNGCGSVHTAIAARIIEAHGGRLKCESDVIRAWLPISNES